MHVTPPLLWFLELALEVLCWSDTGGRMEPRIHFLCICRDDSVRLVYCVLLSSIDISSGAKRPGPETDYRFY